MGINVYARWQGQNEKEKKAQITGFSVRHGHVGYLREAYHGEPYATRFLCREAFASGIGESQISAKVMRDRLPETLDMVDQRERRIYKQKDQAKIDLVKKSFSDFVELCEHKEKKTGVPCTITVSW